MAEANKNNMASSKSKQEAKKKERKASDIVAPASPDPRSKTASKKKTRKRPAPKLKFDYDSQEFYTAIEELANAGYSDASIAYGLADKFGKGLAPETFSRFKNEQDDKGEPTERAKSINQALARGRSGILQAARSTYYQMALGQRKTSIVRRNAVQKRCPCCFENDMSPKDDCKRCGGTGWYYLTDKVITEESEMEIAPNMQALATFLYNNDPEWRDNILRKKREEAEAAAAGGDSGLPTAVNIRITYNQKEDLALQEKFKKPSQ
ncbi:MAG: hypothetical protein IKX67_07200 [Bacteroidales bacterium]|nr:hypothetical protein [Bacteroidales bacterium]